MWMAKRSEFLRQCLIPTKDIIWCAWPCDLTSCKRVLAFHLQLAIWEHTPFAEGKWGLCSPPDKSGGTQSRFWRYEMDSAKDLSWCANLRVASAGNDGFLKPLSLNKSLHLLTCESLRREQALWFWIDSHMQRLAQVYFFSPSISPNLPLAIWKQTPISAMSGELGFPIL